MKTLNGQIEGVPIAKYKMRQFTLTCKISNGFYCVTFHNGRYTNITRYSKDKDEMNRFILKAIEEGYRRIF